MDVYDHGILLRSRAIGMLDGGFTQKKVAQDLNVSISSVKRWSSLYKKGSSLVTKPRSGRPPILKRTDNTVISKSLGKCRQSSRKLAQKLKNRGNAVAHMCVHRHLTESVGVRSFKRQEIPRLSQKNIQDRLSFARKHQNWTVNDWKKFSGQMSLPSSSLQRQTNKIIGFGQRISNMFLRYFQLSFQQRFMCGA
ncbi:hypothetical protein LOD99_1875 [Oopsacas minuta]|uniref:Transposase Tc1-like domain-containing protein n=1 Tax=Oopsacas minuta TaxID=111878 RepID=A0AAV7K4M0_9METZ|nr:hypothetical protein LOD99_1875 [Oopsacas minuta]